MKQHIKRFFFVFLLLSGFYYAAYAQEIVIHDADSAWMNQEIPSKALSEKKFNFLRRWFQNTVTRYNFFFNCQTTFQKAASGAKKIHEDNYDSVLSINPYEPVDFKMLQSYLDSVIRNGSIGIQIHDPRSKWVKQLYLLVGKAYFYKGDYDKAINTFKYMIKNLGEKDKMDRPMIIGSRTYHSEKNISIMTLEKKEKRFPPARNDAFIWLVRSYLKKDQLDKVATLISAIASDPHLPDRLLAPLKIIQSNYLRQTGHEDAALTALRTAIPLLDNKKLQARRQFVLSQLYEKQGLWDRAINSYRKVELLYEPTPKMEFYSELHNALIRSAQKPKEYIFNRDLFLRIATKRKFAHYRNVLYQYLGKLAFEAGFYESGIAYLKKSLTFQTKDKKTRIKTYLILANTYFKQSKYRTAKKYYDKVAQFKTQDSPINQKRVTALTEIVQQLDIIKREDSLQRLAAWPKDSLYSYLHQIVEDSLKKRKKKNLVLDGSAQNGNQLSQNQKKNTPFDNNKASSDAWYFYNNNIKARGYTQFKSEWGDRPLEDNWRLSNPNAYIPSNKPSSAAPVLSTDLSSDKPENDFNLYAQNIFQKLLDPLPLTQEATSKSQKKKMDAYHKIINLYYLQLHDDTATISAIRELLSLKKNNPYIANCYYKLYLIYSDNNRKGRADYYKGLLQKEYPNSKYAAILNPEKQKNPPKDTARIIEHLYNVAYQNYLSGELSSIPILRDSAIHLASQNKQSARFDLLNAMRLIKISSQDTAKAALQKVIKKHASDTLITQQAKLFLENMEHKNELIKHFQTISSSQKDTATIQQKKVSPTIRPDQEEAETSVDKAQKKEDRPQKKVKKASPKQPMPYKIKKDAPYFVILYFNKTYTDLIQNVQKTLKAYNQKFHAKDSVQVSLYVLKQNQVILIFRTFENEKEALSYYKELKMKAKSNIIPKIDPNDYQFFFISRDNFIILNNSQDLKGYLTFFRQHYR